MNVYTYYQTLNGVYPEVYLQAKFEEDRELATLEVWKDSWKKAGFIPQVLNELDAKKHPRFEYFSRKFSQLPTPYEITWQRACFMRWVAMSVVGGLLLDYDVINYSFSPSDLRAFNDDKMRIFCDSPPDFF